MHTTQYSMSVEILSTTAQLYEQVTRLSETNPRDALHHGKQQNFKTVT